MSPSLKAHTMPRTSYYFVNHTLSEFCCFDENISVLDALEATFNKWPEWKRNQMICVVAEENCKQDKIDTLLNERGYRWLDIDADAAAAAPAN